MKNDNGSDPASAIEINGFGQYAPEAFLGMTKRETIAMHIMANTCWSVTDRNQSQHYQYAAESAVSLADELLKALDK